MSTQHDIDRELVDLVRAADPLRIPRAQSHVGLDTEMALCRIVAQLDGPPVTRHRPRRRSTLRIAVLACAVTAVVFAIANIASTGSDSAVSPAQARAILGHIRTALVFPPHAVYEEETVTTVPAHDGVTHTSGWHEWLSTSPPYNNRSIQFANGKVLLEQAFVNGRLDLYDPATNTIYLAPAVTDEDVTGCQRCSSDTPQSNSALSEIRYLLHQPNVTINHDAVLNGRRAIKLTFDRGRLSYWISPRTYRPLQVEDRLFGRITRFPIIRVLTGSAAASTLVSLHAQHPGTRVDRSSADYAAAKSRMIGYVSPPPKIVCRTSRRCGPAPIRRTNDNKH